ncbi:PulJ/GspJ family protein [Euzebya tangerina]|uniref:PulJ/GspJ family protein n=1 Tax=Euzebya tangerina TaxID=591198 RepID=UPI0013C2FD6D|nr:type II secretion system protein [Euzebya tangerina]
MFRKLRDRLRLAEDAQAGFTLPELLVSITLLTIVSAAIVSSTVAIQRTLGGAQATMRDLATTDIALDRVGQLIRGAVGPDGTVSESNSALIAAAPDDITFLSTTGRTAVTLPDGSYANRHPMQVRLFVRTDADGAFELVEQIWDPINDNVDDGPFVLPANPRERVILRDLIDVDTDTAFVDVFRFWSHYEDVLSPDPSQRCGRVINEGTTLSAVERTTIDSVSFRLVSAEPNNYDGSIDADLQGFARFAGSTDLGVSSSFVSAACLDDPNFRNGFDQVFP